MHAVFVEIMYDPNALKLYVDGSALENPGTGGYSVIADYPDFLQIESMEVASCGYVETTNNRMELRAVIEALRYSQIAVKEYKLGRVIIVSDSQYVCDSQGMASDWKKNGGRNKERRPMDNMDMWEEFIKLKPKVKAHVEVVWEAGKKRNITKQVDRAAKAAARTQGRTDFGFRKPRLARTRVQGGTASMFPARGQTEIIRVFKYEYKAETEWEVTFDLATGEKKEYTIKHFAYYEGKDMSCISRHGIYEAVFNDNPKYPKILSISKK